MSNMYEFIGSNTWNPLAGCCSHFCKYCFVNSLKERFPVMRAKYSGEIRLDEKAMKKNLGTGKIWFVCSCNDLFAENVPGHMIIRILEHLQKFDNTYLLQTKNPSRYQQFREYFPPDVILATTIETDNAQILKHITDNNAILPGFRAYWTKVLSRLDYKTMVTMEPIMTFNLDKIVDWMKDISPIQVNIGANSNPKVNLPEPTGEEIGALIKALRDAGIKVHLKDTLNRLYTED